MILWEWRGKHRVPSIGRVFCAHVTGRVDRGRRCLGVDLVCGATGLDQHNLPLFAALAIDESRIGVLFSLYHQEPEADKLSLHLTTQCLLTAFDFYATRFDAEMPEHAVVGLRLAHNGAVNGALTRLYNVPNPGTDGFMPTQSGQGRRSVLYSETRLSLPARSARGESVPPPVLQST